MKKSLALLLCTILATGMLIGCGSSESANTETPANTESSSAEETKADKTWVVATDTVFKPFEYTNENNEFVGKFDSIFAIYIDGECFCCGIIRVTCSR